MAAKQPDETSTLENEGFSPVPLIDRPSSGDLVAIHVRTLIFNGELRQGDRVHQDDIVHGLDEDALRDHYELLGLVYGLAARRAVSRATSDARARLRSALDSA